MTIRLSRTGFMRTVSDVVNLLRPTVKDSLDNVQIVVRDWPSPEQLSEAGIGESDLLGLYEGTPRTEREHYNFSLPDLIWLFKRPLELECETHQQLTEEIRITILHEIGHHLGWDDKQLEELQA